MAKEVKAKAKMRIPGGGATPAPPVGAVLGQLQVNIMEFCKQFNAKTANRKGQTCPVMVTVYKDKSFDFVIKTPPTSELIKEKVNIKKGSAKPNEVKNGKIRMADIDEIVKIKMPDLNAYDLEQARTMIIGSARSMGVEVVE